jgi:hypothetical protein
VLFHLHSVFAVRTLLSGFGDRIICAGIVGRLDCAGSVARFAGGGCFVGRGTSADWFFGRVGGDGRVAGTRSFVRGVAHAPLLGASLAQTFAVALGELGESLVQVPLSVEELVDLTDVLCSYSSRVSKGKSPWSIRAPLSPSMQINVSPDSGTRLVFVSMSHFPSSDMLGITR